MITPLLVGSGAGGLVWRRIRRSELGETSAALELRQVYRQQVLQNAVREEEIEQILHRLRSAGIEPLLIKGWAIARLYPEEGLRPLGDIDLYVRPEHRERAEGMGFGWTNQHQVDLQHQAYAQSSDLRWDGIYARSVSARLGGTEVRIPCPEDHLALICMHFLQHGGWRPLWLCDVSVALESRPPGFDWDLYLGSDRRRADRIACVIGLAHQILGARVDGTPVAWRSQHLPRWLVPAVLAQWESPCYTDHPAVLEPIASVLRRPGSLAEALQKRWPDPIRATLLTGGRFSDLPRWPFQAASYGAAAARYLGRLISG